MEAQIICGLNMRCVDNNETRTPYIHELCRIMDFFLSIADKEPRYAMASVGQIRLTDSAGERIEWCCSHERIVVSIHTISMANQWSILTLLL